MVCGVSLQLPSTILKTQRCPKIAFIFNFRSDNSKSCLYFCSIKEYQKFIQGYLSQSFHCNFTKLEESKCVCVLFGNRLLRIPYYSQRMSLTIIIYTCLLLFQLVTAQNVITIFDGDAGNSVTCGTSGLATSCEITELKALTTRWSPPVECSQPHSTSINGRPVYQVGCGSGVRSSCCPPNWLRAGSYSSAVLPDGYQTDILLNKVPPELGNNQNGKYACPRYVFIVRKLLLTPRRRYLIRSL